MAPIPRGEDYSKIYSKRLFKINYLGVKYCEKKSISETRIINFNYLIKILNYRQNHSRPLHLKSIYLKTLSLFRIPFKYETTSQHLIELESRSDRHERKRQPVDKVEEILCSKIDETTLNPRYNPGLRLQQDVSLSLSLFRIFEKRRRKQTCYILSRMLSSGWISGGSLVVGRSTSKRSSSQSKSRFESRGGERKGVKAESGFSQESNSLPSSRGIGRSSSRRNSKNEGIIG